MQDTALSELVARIRSNVRESGAVAADAPAAAIREVRMFGAIAVMVNDEMLVAVNGDGSLLVRVHPEADPSLILRPGATRAEMGKTPTGEGRSMGAGWIRVDGSALTPEALTFWVSQALQRRTWASESRTDTSARSS